MLCGRYKFVEKMHGGLELEKTEKCDMQASVTLLRPRDSTRMGALLGQRGRVHGGHCGSSHRYLPAQWTPLCDHCATRTTPQCIILQDCVLALLSAPVLLCSTHTCLLYWVLHLLC